MSEDGGLSDVAAPDKVSPSTNLQDTPKICLFPETKTPFGIIQREAERVGIPSTTHKKQITTVVREDQRTGGHILAGKVGIVATESLVGVEVKAEADQAIFVIDNKEYVGLPHKHDPIATEVKVGDLNALARGAFGLAGVGGKAGASANLVQANIGPVTGVVGLSATSGLLVSPTQFDASALGTGIQIGEITGISVMGTSISVDLGRLGEAIGNRVTHDLDPHAFVRSNIVALGNRLDTHHMMHNTINKIDSGVDEVISTVGEVIGVPVCVVSNGLGKTIDSVENLVKPNKKKGLEKGENVVEAEVVKDKT